MFGYRAITKGYFAIRRGYFKMVPFSDTNGPLICPLCTYFNSFIENEVNPKVWTVKQLKL